MSYVLSSQTWHSSVNRAPNTDETADMEIGAVWNKGNGQEQRQEKKRRQGNTSVLRLWKAWPPFDGMLV